VKSAFLTVLLAVLLIAGCGGPELRIEVVPERDVARVYFKPTKDATGNEISQRGPEIYLGETPVEWEVPEHLLGGAGQARLEFSGGKQNEVWITILPDRDTYVKVAPPPIVK